jgi:hypothetical protein
VRDSVVLHHHLGGRLSSIADLHNLQRGFVTPCTGYQNPGSRTIKIITKGEPRSKVSGATRQRRTKACFHFTVHETISTPTFQGHNAVGIGKDANDAGR